MPDFKSRKPKAAWMSAAEKIQAKTGYPASSMTPNNMTNPVINRGIIGHDDAEVSSAGQQILAYANAKKRSSR